MALLPGVGAAGKLFNIGGKILGKSADAVEAAHRVATSGSMVLMGLGEAYYAKESLRDSYEAFKKGDYLGAALSLGEAGMSIVGAKQGLKSVKGLTIGRYSHCQERRVYDWTSNQDSCFVAGTPVEWEFGTKAIEQILRGERVWSRNENDPNAPLTLQLVEETFVRQALIFALTINGRTIRTTAEHPFFRMVDGWVTINLLQIGDRLRCKDGTYVVLQQIVDTGEYETVYNMRVAETHTYYVGGGEWGFGVWVHNARYNPQQQLAQDGDKARRSLRSNMKRSGTVNADQEAHHVVPHELNDHPVVVAAANNGWEANRGRSNGVGLDDRTTSLPQHNGSHPRYTAKVENKLDAISQRHGGPATDGAQAEFTDYVSKMQNALPNLTKRLS